MKADVIVVGGGPAGMMAAGTAARHGLQVLLLEKNPRLGRKLMITGKGRCNVTNNCDVQDFLNHIPTNPRFLQSAVHRFTPQDAMAFFEELGVPLKTERGNRVFPVSDKAVDIVDAMVKFVRQSGVTVQYDAPVKALSCQGGAAAGVILKNGETLQAGSVILATGGKSYPRTGSTGDGYRLAEQVGHTIVPARPSLVPIETQEDWCQRAQGLSLKNVTLSAVDAESGKTIYRELGEMLFTHFGVSGPLVLSLSVHLGDLSKHHYRLLIDLKPALDLQALDARLLRDFGTQQNKDFGNSLEKLLPRKLIPIIISLSGISSTTKVNQITREQRRRLCELLKAVPLTVWRFRPIDEAVVTSGGVKVGEINPKTMESKLVKGLFFAGELIRLCGWIRLSRGIFMIAVAIDGPAGAGKSTIAKAVAAKLRYVYVDTGALYRAIGWYALSHQVDTQDAGVVTALLPEISLSLKFVNGEQRVFVNGEDVSVQIRYPEASMAASHVSAIPAVREFLFSLQQNLAKENNVIMDGRDIGTVVLPNAQIKIFLTASAEDRATRRFKQLEEAGTPVDYDKLLAEIKERDYNDSHRAIAPLKQADDAQLVDTTGESLEESVARVEGYIRERLKQLGEEPTT